MKKIVIFSIFYLISRASYAMDGKSLILSKRDEYSEIIKQGIPEKQWWYLKKEKVIGQNCKAEFCPNGNEVIIKLDNCVRLYDKKLERYKEFVWDSGWKIVGKANNYTQELLLIKDDNKTIALGDISDDSSKFENPTYYLFSDPVSYTTLSDDGKYIIILFNHTSHNKPTMVVDRDNNQIASCEIDDGCEAIFGKSSSIVAVRSSGSKINVWDLKAGSVIKLNDNDTHSVNSIKIDPTEKFVATTESPCNKTCVREICSGKTTQLVHYGYVETASFHPKGDKFVVTSSWDQMVRVWNYINGKELVRLHHNDCIFSAEYHPEGNELLTVSNKKLYFWKRYENFTIQQLILRELLNNWLLVKKPKKSIDTEDKLFQDETLQLMAGKQSIPEGFSCGKKFLRTEGVSVLRELWKSFETCDETKLVRTAMIALILDKISRYGKDW